MHGPAQRLIRKHGSEYTVRNASATGGGRDVPTYSDDGTLVGVLEQRGMPRTAIDSAGTEVETDLEIRTVLGSNVTIHEPGEESQHPTKLVHPSGQTYVIVDSFPEDSGVTVLTVVRD